MSRGAACLTSHLWVEVSSPLHATAASGEFGPHRRSRSLATVVPQLRTALRLLPSRPGSSPRRWGCSAAALHLQPGPVPGACPEQLQTVLLVGRVCLVVASQRFRGALHAPLPGQGQRVLDVVAVPVTAVRAQGSRWCKRPALFHAEPRSPGTQPPPLCPREKLHSGRRRSTAREGRGTPGSRPLVPTSVLARSQDGPSCEAQGLHLARL